MAVFKQSIVQVFNKEIVVSIAPENVDLLDLADGCLGPVRLIRLAGSGKGAGAQQDIIIFRLSAEDLLAADDAATIATIVFDGCGKLIEGTGFCELLQQR